MQLIQCGRIFHTSFDGLDLCRITGILVQFFVDLCQFARVEGPSTDVAVLRACFDLDLFEIGADAQCMPNGILPIATRGAIEVGEMCANKLVDLRHGQLSILAVS